jgi:hypothetical protein
LLRAAKTPSKQKKDGLDVSNKKESLRNLENTDQYALSPEAAIRR